MAILDLVCPPPVGWKQIALHDVCSTDRHWSAQRLLTVCTALCIQFKCSRWSIAIHRSERLNIAVPKSHFIWAGWNRWAHNFLRPLFYFFLTSVAGSSPSSLLTQSKCIEICLPDCPQIFEGPLENQRQFLWRREGVLLWFILSHLQTKIAMEDCRNYLLNMSLFNNTTHTLTQLTSKRHWQITDLHSCVAHQQEDRSCRRREGRIERQTQT